MAIPESRPQRIAFALAGGAALSLFKLLLHCRNASSEACVWGKAYLPIELPIEAVIFGAGIFVILTMMRRPPE